MAGLKVVPVACDEEGNVDQDDLAARAEEFSDRLAALMVTYPSTHGVFEPGIRQICSVVHRHGGQVYLDGANLNAQVGLCRPGAFGRRLPPESAQDLLHSAWRRRSGCRSHWSGGAPCPVPARSSSSQPSHGDRARIGCPWRASILPISWMYLRMMGAEALRQASAVALLSANYLAHRLDRHYPVLFRGSTGCVAHECILDLRPLKRDAGVDVDDIAKRLMDYGFHAPTVSWPVAGTVMVEPTESESLAELDRFADAMIAIREEVRDIEAGRMDPLNNPLKRAPHTMAVVTADVQIVLIAPPQPSLVRSADQQAVACNGRIDNAFVIGISSALVRREELDEQPVAA